MLKPILLVLLALYLMVGLFNFWVFMQTPRSLTDPWWAMILLWPLYWDWAYIFGMKP
jgi:hypothetical protein